MPEIIVRSDILTEVTEAALRYGDGEIEVGFNFPEDVQDRIDSAREHIDAGEWSADDYEPMEVLTRKVITKKVTEEWEIWNG